VLLCVFVGAIIQRDLIRAHWWAIQLAKTQDPDRRAYYLASLAAVGRSAIGAIDGLAHHERPETRALAVVALARLPEQAGLDELARLLGDADQDVADSAALSLAFMQTAQPRRVLTEAAPSAAPTTAAAATAALSRVDAPEALAALCAAATEHPHPQVRAQAVESLAVWIMSAQPAARPPPPGRSASGAGHSQPAAEVRPPPPCDPVSVMVAALGDQAEFTGLLALERQIANAAAAADRHVVTPSGIPFSPSAEPAGRTVAEVAAAGLGRMTGRKFDHRVPTTPADRARLVAQCRQWLANRQAAETGETDD
jgi:hypothetical protein